MVQCTICGLAELERALVECVDVIVRYIYHYESVPIPFYKWQILTTFIEKAKKVMREPVHFHQVHKKEI